MKRFFQRVLRVSKQYGLTAAGAVAVVGFLVYERNRRNPVYASWTTNYDPSVKWDHNWDRYQLALLLFLFKQRPLILEQVEEYVTPDFIARGMKV